MSTRVCIDADTYVRKIILQLQYTEMEKGVEVKGTDGRGKIVDGIRDESDEKATFADS